MAVSYTHLNKYSKCTHRNYPMIELKQYIDNIVLNSHMFFYVAVPIMREINTNIRRLSAHTTITVSYTHLDVYKRQTVITFISQSLHSAYHISK